MALNILIFTFKTEPGKFHIYFIRNMILVKQADRTAEPSPGAYSLLLARYLNSLGRNISVLLTGSFLQFFLVQPNVNVVNLGKSLIMKSESCYQIYFPDVSSLISVANKMAFSLFIVEVFRRFVYPL